MGTSHSPINAGFCLNLDTASCAGTCHGHPQRFGRSGDCTKARDCSSGASDGHKLDTTPADECTGCYIQPSSCGGGPGSRGEQA